VAIQQGGHSLIGDHWRTTHDSIETIGLVTVYDSVMDSLELDKFLRTSVPLADVSRQLALQMDDSASVDCGGGPGLLVLGSASVCCGGGPALLVLATGFVESTQLVVPTST
jgi:hypothetical protein